MKISKAIATRIREIINEKGITQYKLEQNSGVPHNTMISLMNGRYKSCNLTTLIIIIQTLGISVSKFFDSPLFNEENLDVG